MPNTTQAPVAPNALGTAQEWAAYEITRAKFEMNMAELLESAQLNAPDDLKQALKCGAAALRILSFARDDRLRLFQRKCVAMHLQWEEL